MKYQKYLKLRDSVFRRVVGVSKKTFEAMATIVKDSCTKARGRKPALCAEDRVLLSLNYLREYNTFLSIGLSFGVCEATAYNTHILVERALLQSGDFNVRGKGCLLEKTGGTIVIDGTESAIERPKIPVKNKKRVKNRRNKQKFYYSGKKKRHTMKSQIIIDKDSKEVLAIDCCNGKKHDFKLFEESKSRILPQTSALFDTGYLGVHKIHLNSLVPKRNSKKDPLTPEDKENNRLHSSARVVVEHVIGSLKRFKIIASKYRNRRSKFALRMNLIAGIYNFELKN